MSTSEKILHIWTLSRGVFITAFEILYFSKKLFMSQVNSKRLFVWCCKHRLWKTMSFCTQSKMSSHSSQELFNVFLTVYINYHCCILFRGTYYPYGLFLNSKRTDLYLSISRYLCAVLAPLQSQTIAQFIFQMHSNSQGEYLVSLNTGLISQ